MHRITGLLATAVLGLALAACSSANAAAPAGSPTAAPASAGAPAPSSSATASDTVLVDAKDIAFAETSVNAPASVPFQLTFNNEDGAPHNVTIVGPDGNPVFTGDVINGPASTTYTVPALAPGTYTFRCDIHPNMTGTLVVH